MATAPSPKTAVLNSWKEIAAYLGRGVRTVQRYERDLGLPVRRPRGTSRSAVIALASELDSWLCAAPTTHSGNGRELQLTAPIASTRESRDEASQLRDQCHALRAAHEQAVAKLITNLTQLVEEIHVSSKLKVNDGGDIPSKSESGT